MTKQIDNLIGTIHKARYSNRMVRVTQMAPMKKFVNTIRVEQHDGEWVEVTNTDRVIKAESLYTNYTPVGHVIVPRRRGAQMYDDVYVGAIHKSKRHSTIVQVVGSSPLFSTVDIVEVYFCNNKWKAIPTTQRSVKLKSLHKKYKHMEQGDQQLTNYVYKARRSQHLVEVQSVNGQVVVIRNVDDKHNAIAGSTRQIKRSSLESGYKAIQPK